MKVMLLIERESYIAVVQEEPAWLKARRKQERSRAVETRKSKQTPKQEPLSGELSST